MTRITSSKTFETSKYTTTKSGQELEDLILFLADFVEQVTGALNNGLTFADNFKCKVARVSLKDDTAQVVGTDGKSVVGIIPVRVHSTTVGIESFTWSINSQGNTTVTVGFTGSQAASIDVTLVLLFS